MDASPQIREARHEAERLSAAQYALVLQFDYIARWLGRFYARRVPRWLALKEDLVQAGREGLCRAAVRFVPDRGIKFQTFASSYIRGEILHYLRAMRPAPRQGMRPFLVPLEEIEGRPEAFSYAEFERAEAMAMLQADLQVLPERYRRVLVLQGLGVPQRVLAKREGVSQRTISRMFTAAAKVVREGKGADKLGRAPGRPGPVRAERISSPEEWLARMNVLYPSDPIVLSRKSRGGRKRALEGKSLVWTPEDG